MKINSIIRTYWTTMENVINMKSKRANSIFSESFNFIQTKNDNSSSSVSLVSNMYAYYPHFQMIFIDASDTSWTLSPFVISSSAFSTKYCFFFLFQIIFSALFLLPINNIIYKNVYAEASRKFIRGFVVLLDHTIDISFFVSNYSNFTIHFVQIRAKKNHLMSRLQLKCTIYLVSTYDDKINRTASHSLYSICIILCIWMYSIIHKLWIQNCVKLYLLGKVLDVFWCDNGMTINFQ